jgi:hypothetical protein
MAEDLKTYALISKEGIDIADLNYYMEKDTSSENTLIREYYPDREIKATERWNNNRLTLYDLTEDEVRQLKNNPDVYDVDYVISQEDWSFGPEDPTIIDTGSYAYILEPLPIQESIFSANLNSDNASYLANSYITITSASLYSNKGAPINWGLKFHTSYTESVDWEELLQVNPTSGTSLYSKSGYPYTLDGTGVDLVILDSGVKPHPEFLDDEGNLRLVEFDWYQYIPGVSMPDQFYTRYGATTPQHGTHVASIAAGRTNGWAKNAKIYSFKIFRTATNPIVDGGTIQHALEAIRHFHVSKSIDPKTGFRRPTIVNASIGMSTEIVKTYPPVFISDPNYHITRITNIYYKGNSLGLSGNNNVPSLKHNIRHQYTSSIYDPPGYFTLIAPISPSYINVLMKQLTDAGVIFIKSAGNNQSIISKAYDANNPQYYKDIYNTYLTSEKYIGFDPPGSPIYTNRADFDSPDTIVVGSMSPFLTFKNSKITNPLDPGYDSYTYDIWNVRGTIPYYLPDQFYHGDPLLWDNSSGKLPGFLNYPPRRGMGSQSLFPGWEYTRVSSSLSVSPYSNVGPAVDIFAAGHFIAGAWFRDPFYNTNSSITSSYINYKNYDPNYIPTHPSLSLNEYMYVISGTSMAAPQIAGIACLYFQLNPGATAKQFKLFLSASAIKTPQMQLFSEDPENAYDYTGSMFTSVLQNALYTKSQTIALNGAPTLAAHWPYSNPNKAEVSSVRLTKI